MMAGEYFIDVNSYHNWVIDWSKVTAFEHIKKILMCCNMRPSPNHPEFEELKHLCKLVDQRGVQVDPKTLLPIQEEKMSNWREPTLQDFRKRCRLIDGGKCVVGVLRGVLCDIEEGRKPVWYMSVNKDGTIIEHYNIEVLDA